MQHLFIVSHKSQKQQKKKKNDRAHGLFMKFDIVNFNSKHLGILYIEF